MVLVAEKKSFIKPQTLDDMLKNLYTNYPRIKRGITVIPTQPQPLPSPASTNDGIANDDETLAAIALGFTDIEESPTATLDNNSSPSSMYEWKPNLRGIINYDKKNTMLNFGSNDKYSSGTAYMSMFFFNNSN